MLITTTQRNVACTETEWKTVKKNIDILYSVDKIDASHFHSFPWTKMVATQFTPRCPRHEISSNLAVHQEKFGAESAGLRAISWPGAPGSRRPSNNKHSKIVCNLCKSAQMLLPMVEHMLQQFDCKSIRNNPRIISRAPHGLRLQ